MLKSIPPIDRDFHSTCAAAIRTGENVIVTDLIADARFSDHVATAASLGYQAAFSFPLKTRRAEFQGVLTVHFRTPHSPADRELQWAALYAPLAAHLIERQRTADALRDSEARLAAVFEASPTPFLILAPSDFRIIAVNDAYLHATMTRRAEIIGKRVFDIFPDNPDEHGASGVRNLNASRQRVLATGRGDVMPVQKYDIRHSHAENGGFVERWWSLNNAPVLGPNGEVTAIIHRVEDVTKIVDLRSEGEASDQPARSTERHRAPEPNYSRADPRSRNTPTCRSGFKGSQKTPAASPGEKQI